jgi:UDP-4-amino-4,6-dideoxy-N-acetyl-beta-L-altrosamine transaminase
MGEKLAILGGIPVRQTMLPYGHQSVDEADIQAVVEVLRGDWLTTGPAVSAFEKAMAGYVGAKEAVVVNSGTAALHAAAFAAGIGPGDEVIVPAITFAASANCVLYMGGCPVFADVLPGTLNVDPNDVVRKITPRTKAIIPVDYTGQPCDHDALRALADAHGLIVIEDAAHALGATYRGRKVGTLHELTTLSFHPVKHITTGEGGMIVTDDSGLAACMRAFRSHGITADFRQRAEAGSWVYEMVALGYNYRLPDLNCVLGLSQLKKLDGWLARRRMIAARYTEAFADLPTVELLEVLPDTEPAWHLAVIKLNLERLRVGRKEVFAALRAENIGVNVHYIPVYWHPYYQRLGYTHELCPVAEAAYERLITLPMFSAMADQDVEDVIDAVHKVTEAYAA